MSFAAGSASFRSYYELLVVAVLWLPLVFVIVLFFWGGRTLRIAGLILSFFQLSLSVVLFFLTTIAHVEYGWFESKFLSYGLVLDSISLVFVVLTAFLIPVCLLVSWTTVKVRVKEFVLLLFVIEFLLFNVFCAANIFVFYVFFEAILIPMFVLIGVWGSRERKVRAAYQFFLYTLLGSLLMLLGILTIYFNSGTLSIYDLVLVEYSAERQVVLWLAFFASLAVKIPVVPFHIWLPEAHGEAPTAGSVLLAGVLLKMGGYGFLRFVVPFLPLGTDYFLAFLYSISVIGIVYASLVTLRQIDLKKIVAYSSVGHMNYVTMGIFSNSIEGIEGAVFLMLSHGLVSSALFICVGLLYDRYKTRLLQYYGGLAMVMPMFASFFLLFTFANIALPGTSSFVGEFLVVVGVYSSNSLAAWLSYIGVILGAGYSIWFLNRLLYGAVREDAAVQLGFSDLTRREFFVLFVFGVLIVGLGVFPGVVLNALHVSVIDLIWTDSLFCFIR